MKFEQALVFTETGSVYHVDTVNKRFKRVSKTVIGEAT